MENPFAQHTSGRIVLLDVGGSFIKCSDGREIPVDSDGSRDGIAASFREAVGGAAAGVGVAMPAPFDYAKGIFLMRHKFAAVYGESFRDVAGIPEDVPVGYIHDVNAALRGAIETDPSLREGTVAMITLGTGLGFTVAENGRIAVDAEGAPKYDLWNMPYGDSILEDYISRRGIRNRYKDGSVDVKELSAMARRGNINAAAAFRNAGADLSYGALPLLEELGVRKVLFGGQIARSLDLFEIDFGDIVVTYCKDFSGAVMRGAEAALRDAEGKA